MTTRHRVLPLIIRLFSGAIAGLMIADGVCLLFMFLTEKAGLTEGRYDSWLAVGLAVLFLVTMGGVVVVNVKPELGRQQSAYRDAINCCVQCGYSLRGIRRIAGRCPECGKRIKPKC